MRKFGYVVVEGPHDVELVYRLLSPHGMARVRHLADLDSFLVPLVPRSFPPDGDLQKRVPVPLFLQSRTHAVAIHSATGDTRLIQTVEENATLLDRASLTGIGVVLDSDSVAPADRYLAVRDGLRVKGYALPDGPGVVSVGTPRLGAFVLPDNTARGTLEDILLDCARHVYPTLLQIATTHVDSALGDTSLVDDDLVEIRKSAGRNKAIIGAMASILRPERAIQVSVQDNRWLRDTALALPRVASIQAFLMNLLEIPLISSLE
jgi:hypothetical protein